MFGTPSGELSLLAFETEVGGSACADDTAVGGSASEADALCCMMLQGALGLDEGSLWPLHAMLASGLCMQVMLVGHSWHLTAGPQNATGSTRPRCT